MRTFAMLSSISRPICSSETLRALIPRPAAGFTTTASAAYSSCSSRASAASGMPVMPTMVAPSRSRRSISALVSRRGPCTAAYVPPSTTGMPTSVAAAIAIRRIVSL